MTMTAARPEQGVTTPAEHRPRVLIVDDDDVVRMLFQDICAEHGWNALTAATAADGILASGLQRVDLVLLDLHLDKDDGDPLACLRAIRTICPATPVIVVTGECPEKHATAIAQAGGQGVVAKPCQVAEVGALLRRYRPAMAEAAVSR